MFSCVHVCAICMFRYLCICDMCVYIYIYICIHVRTLAVSLLLSSFSLPSLSRRLSVLSVSRLLARFFSFSLACFFSPSHPPSLSLSLARSLLLSHSQTHTCARKYTHTHTHVDAHKHTHTHTHTHILTHARKDAGARS